MTSTKKLLLVLLLLCTHLLLYCGASVLNAKRSADASDDDTDNNNNNNDNGGDDSSDIENKLSSPDAANDNNNENGNSDDAEEEHIESTTAAHIELESDETQEGSKLLIILVDGVRYDYVSRDRKLKGFPRIAANGVHAEYVKPIFPANSYPNWYTIVTGLYAESHGIIGNYMYDIERDDMFLMAPQPNASHAHWWDKAEPIWINAEKNGVKAAMYLWDGCQVTIHGSAPTVCLPYKSLYDGPTAANETRKFLDTVLDHFQANKYRLALVYYEFVDHTGHRYGPQSTKTKQAVRDIDDILNDLQDNIEKSGLEDVNVVVVSDHGMIKGDSFAVIHIEEFLDFNDVEVFLGGGSTAQILPEEGKEDEVYKQLREANIKGLNVYRKKNSAFPERFHVKNSALLLPILITADKGYLIRPPLIKNKVYPGYSPSQTPSKGFHGFDPDHVTEMRTTMYAFGPAFRANYTSKWLEQVDHYNLFCKLIGIEPKPNNGSESRIEKLLKEAETEEINGDSDSDDDEEEKDEEEEDNDNGDGVYTSNRLHVILIYGLLLKFCINWF